MEIRPSEDTSLWISCRICKSQIHIDSLPDHECASSPPVTPVSVAAAKRASKVIKKYLDSPKQSTKTRKSPQRKTSEVAMMNLLCLKSKIKDIRVTNAGYAVYIVVTTCSNGMEFHTERRYSEFYQFALQLDTIHPLHDLWQQFPPKTYCRRSIEKEFLHRRREGLETFLSDALDRMLDHSKSEGPDRKGTVGQLFALQQFLDVPSPIDLKIAFGDLKRHAVGSLGWNQCYQYGENDNVYEKYIDGCLALKRIKTVGYSVQQVFQMLMLKFEDPEFFNMCPWILKAEVLRRRSKYTWVEHTISKSWWPLKNRQMVRLQSWRVSSDESIYVVSIPAESADWPDLDPTCQREQLMLTGWILTPTADPNECNVTCLIQGSYGQNMCSYFARSVLWTRIDQIQNIETLLGRNHQKDRLSLVDTSSASDVTASAKHLALCDEAFQLDSETLFVIHKNQNKNIVVVKANRTANGICKRREPVVGYWILFQKQGKPKKTLSHVEKTTTYSIAFHSAGSCAFTLDLSLLRDRTVTLRPIENGTYGVFCHIGDEPEAQLRRIYLRYSSTLPGAQLINMDICGVTAKGLQVCETKTA